MSAGGASVARGARPRADLRKAGRRSAARVRGRQSAYRGQGRNGAPPALCRLPSPSMTGVAVRAGPLRVLAVRALGAAAGLAAVGVDAALVPLLGLDALAELVGLARVAAGGAFRVVALVAVVVMRVRHGAPRARALRSAAAEQDCRRRRPLPATGGAPDAAQHPFRPPRCPAGARTACGSIGAIVDPGLRSVSRRSSRR